MKFVFDPSIAVKIDKMKRRVRWQESIFKAKNINQTKLIIDDHNTDNLNFSFLVIGDSGCGSHLKHHPLYVTETTKWNQGQTLAIRKRLCWVFDNVVTEIGALPDGRSVVDIVISGHAHCMEYLSTKKTGSADSHINWIVCGGSGHSLRRQRREGSILFQDANLNSQPIAQSHLFLGRYGSGKNKKRPYSFLRIDVQAVDKPQFTVTPYVAEWHQRQWNEYAINPFVI